MSSFFDIDTYIALGLIGLILVVFLINRISLLPKKSGLFLIGGIFGIVGIFLFRNWRTKSVLRDLRKREEKLKEMEKNLALLKDRYNVSDQELQKATAELEGQRAAYKKTILLIKAKNREEKEKIDKLSAQEVFQEYAKIFPNH